MNREQVVTLMESSRNENEWDNNADTVKKECGGYPAYWWEAIMMSGLAHRVKQSWFSTAVKVLPKPNPEIVDGMAVFTLEPPTPEEIAEIRSKQ